MSATPARSPVASFADQAFSAAADAYARAPGGWEQGIHAAIAGLFRFLAEREPQTVSCIVSERGAGPQALAQREAAIERFAVLLGPGFARAEPPPPRTVGEAICGGIFELVRSHVLERRLERLPEAVPDATLVALAPFTGPQRAIDLASRAPARPFAG